AAGLALQIDLPGIDPGAYQLRSAVRDVRSGQTGSASTFVEIPDFNQRHVDLSSILIWDDDSARSGMLRQQGIIGGGGPVTRVFGPGASLSYAFDVFGARVEKSGGKPKIGKPKIDIEVHLYRGPERIFTGHPISLPISSS